MGRVYPVTENPNSKINLVGKRACHTHTHTPYSPQYSTNFILRLPARVHGFDSHYVVVKRMNDLVYFPCKIGEKAECTLADHFADRRSH